MLAGGQIMFKFASADVQVQIKRSLWAALLSPWLLAALFLYLVTAGLWIWILTKVPLSRAYPFSMLGAALVPVLAHYIFGETLPPTFLIGIALVLAGLVFVQMP
ncbi:EamA family transporter [Devosia sp.]|uniref:EamA family transporter n=1 Tax=Devosia sp. TaxID=1871048 RepID=UPI00345BC150